MYATMATLSLLFAFLSVVAGKDVMLRGTSLKDLEVRSKWQATEFRERSIVLSPLTFRFAVAFLFRIQNGR
jgi:hypothetical protein